MKKNKNQKHLKGTFLRYRKCINNLHLYNSEETYIIKSDTSFQKISMDYPIPKPFKLLDLIAAVHLLQHGVVILEIR